MSTFTLQIITPEKIFFEGEVQRVIVRTTEGDVGILAKHERYVAALPSGPVKVILSDGTERIENSKNQQDLKFAEMKLQRALNRLRVSSMKD